MKMIIKSKWTIFFIGFIVGISTCMLMAFKYTNRKEKVYFKLKKDYCIQNAGYLKAGTIIQIDEGMSEGFDRFILYLNLSSGQKLDIYEAEHKNTVIPYWLTEKDTTCKY